MSQGTRWFHHVRKMSAAIIPTSLIEKGQNRVIDASLTLIRERAKLKVSILSNYGFLFSQLLFWCIDVLL